MLNSKKFYSFIAVSYLIILVVFASLTHLDLLDVQIYDRIEIGKGLNDFVKFVFYSINIYFMILIVSRNTDYKNIKYFIWYPLIPVPLYFFPYDFSFISSYIFPIVFILLLYFSKKFKDLTFKKLVLRFLFLMITTMIVQYLLYFVRFGSLNISAAQNLNIKHYSVLSLDLLIYFYIYFKVVRINAKSKFLGGTVFSFFHAENKRVSETCNDIQKVLDLKSLKPHQRAVFYLLSYSYQFITLFIVLAIGKLNNKSLELAIMLVVFWIGRKILVKSWHSGDLWVCSTVTFVSFYILTLVPFVDVRISLFSGISLSAIFVFILYKLAEFEENYDKLKIIYNKFYSFDLVKCTKDEILERCKIVGLNNEDTAIVLDIFYHQVPIKELTKKLHMTANSIRNKKTRLKKRLLEV